MNRIITKSNNRGRGDCSIKVNIFLQDEKIEEKDLASLQIKSVTVDRIVNDIISREDNIK